jgi:hypothetical protein
MRRWFVYGLLALYQYWLSCCYSILWLLMFQSQWIKRNDDVKSFHIYLWMSVVSCLLRLSSRPKMKIILYDSG